MKTLVVAAIRCSLMLLLPAAAYAISAQWDLDPISGDWNTAANWTPNGIPNGPGDVATFGLSNTTDVSISADTEVNSITFTPAATNPYTITCHPNLEFFLSGAGITNSSGVTQTFVLAAGTGPSQGGGEIFFFNTANAGNLTRFTIEGGTVSGAGGGEVIFANASSAGSAMIVNNGASLNGLHGGVTLIGLFQSDTATAASATLIANGGIGQFGGGRILFIGNSSGGTSRIEVFGNGTLDVSQHKAPSLTIGSIEGDGDVFWGLTR